MGKEKKAKVGRPKTIESPEIMWKLFMDYVAYAKANPIKVKDWVGGMGKQVTRERERPLTYEGFTLYLFEMGIMTDAKDYFSNRDERYIEFVPICSRIREKIRQDQIEGGMAGIYNPSITQRLNNLSEQTKQEQSGTLNVIYQRADSSK
jgi:hypothetical protein